MNFSLYAPSTAIGFEPSTHVGVRNSLHQLADFIFQKLIRNDQRLERVADIAPARRNRSSAAVSS
jgi:hypothetical protein